MAESFALEFPNKLAEVGRACQALTDFLEARGQPPREVYAANLALEELATNIIKYGYDDTFEHRIQLTVQLDAQTLSLSLIDDGHEFNPLQAREVDVTSPIENRAIGGLGIHLVKKLFEQLTYERRDGKNIFTVVKKLNTK